MHRYLRLLALFLGSLASARAEQVVFTEIMYNPAGARPEFIEIRNTTMTPMDIAKWRFTDGISFEFPDFAAGSAQAHILKALERIVVSSADPETTRAAYGIPASVRVLGPWTGLLDNAGETVTLADKNGVTICTVSYKDGGRWPKAADGAGHSLVLRDENRAIDDFRVWRASVYAGGTPGSVEFLGPQPVANPEVGVGQSTVIFNYGDTWRYSIPTADPGTAWQSNDFDDASWESGPGLFGFDSDATPPPPGFQTPLNPEGRITYLFRKTFVFNGNPAGATYAIDQIVDDGATYYLNGAPLGSVGHTPGAWDNGASRTVGNAAEEADALSGEATGLRTGVNVLAVEVHQVNSGSGDLAFGARLKLTTPASVLINEVKPGAAGQGFVEFFNATVSPINLNGYYLSDSAANLTKFRITEDLIVPANGFASVGFSESSLVVGPTTSVSLTHSDGATPVSASSTQIPLDGRSLGRMPAGSSSWFFFLTPTRGAPNAAIADLVLQLRLNEVHFSANNTVDWIELHNLASAPIDATGLFLASRDDFADKVPLGASVPSGYSSVEVAFPLDGGGDITLYLVDSGNNVLATAELERVSGRDSMQALYPTVPAPLPVYETPRRDPEWYSSPTPTRDAANNPSRNTAIVINEIMCDPPSGESSGEFVELFNTSTEPVSLAGWKFRGGIDFDFPGNATIPARGYVVVAGSAAFIRQNYSGATVFGDWSGKLGNKGDLIRLVDSVGNLADEVDYKVGGDWPDLAGGQGSSLELIHPAMDNRRASAWRDSDESNKSSFQTYSVTGTYAQSRADGSPTDYKELHLFNAGDGRTDLRDIALTPAAGGANLLTNVGVISTNGSSASGWLVQGTHGASFIDANGVFHLVADGHGDVRANRVEIDCTALTAGQRYTISFSARWVAGTPRIIAQTWDRSLGKAFLLPIPNNLGTPGAANSQVAAAPLPQVDSVLHSPAVPKPGQPVKVTARVTSATPLSVVNVEHRIDNVNASNLWTSTPMFDNGTNGDAVAADGLFTATFTAQTNSQIVQFYVKASAQNGSTSQSPKLGPARPAMWIVDSRTIPETLRRQRFIISAYDRDALRTSSGQSAKYAYKYPRLSNHYFNTTFIYNETDVYYLGEIHKSGSPWTRSDGNELDRAKWKLPDDRVFRNRQKTSWDNDATGGNRHHNRIIRYLMYLCGFPGSNAEEFVHVVVNGDSPRLRNDTEPTDTELVNRVFGNGSDGLLMQVEDEWWFQDNWNRSHRDANWSYKGTYDPIRYHTDYNLRTRETEYDYSTLIELFQTVSSSATQAKLERILDTNLVMLVAAVRGYAGDWDSQTLNRGKNAYLYRKPGDGRWMYLHWDSDLAFQNAGENVVGGIQGWSTFANQPFARRTLNYYLTELLNKFTKNSGRIAAWFDAEEAASTATTIDRNFYQSWFANRESRILQEINFGGGGNGNVVNAPFAVSTAGGTTSGSTMILNGTAPSSGFVIVVDGHPEVQFAWINQTSWRIANLVLKTGVNTFTLRMLDALGNVVGTTTYSITKTGNAAPFMQLVAEPGSWNVALGETLTLDAASSIDPDGGALQFAWSHSPTTGVTVVHPTSASAVATFATPGVYSFTVDGTDVGDASAAITRDVLAYNTPDFSSFGTLELGAPWLVENATRRDNFPGSSWFSLAENPGNLTLQVYDDSARQLVLNTPTHPVVTRALPATDNWTLQTEVSMDARQTGTFHTGLYLQSVEADANVRWAFGLDGGAAISVKRILSSGASTVGTTGWTASSATLRIRRTPTQLLFQVRVNDVWTTVSAQTLPAGATVPRGGLHLATNGAENARSAFDYIVLADPTNSTTLVSSLRITEVMYNPAAPDAVEFIELQNVGVTSINLLGARFASGSPVDEFIFGDETLAPGEFIVVTSDTAAFALQYGSGIRLAGQWPGGNLSNGGERITLLNAQGNPIHDFTYDDVAPWPVAADGSGPSMEVVNFAGNYNDGANWRASFERGGTPGSLGLGPDSDGDGQPDSLELLFGTDPNNAASSFRVAMALDGAGHMTLTWPTLAGRNYRVDFKDDLASGAWQTLTTISATAASTTFSDPTLPKPPQRFYRIIPLP